MVESNGIRRGKIMNKINVGIIGNGMASRVFHIPVILSVPGLRLRKIVDRHGKPALENHPDVQGVSDAAALCADNDIDLVVIATPNNSHYELVRQALLAGKHVVVEKPFVTTSREARQLIDLASERKRLLTVHQNRRWDGDFQTVRKLVDGKVLGRLVEYESHLDRFRNFPRKGAWREEAGEGSGILFDLGSHLIDQALVLFGLPRMITADIRNQRGFGNADDNFEVLLHYDSLKVILRAGMLVREPGPRFILNGTEGYYVKFSFDPQEEALKNGHSPSEPGWGKEPRGSWGRLNTQIEGLHVEGQIETMAGCYQDFYSTIAEAIAGRMELAVKPEEALNTIRIIELANQSSEQKRSLPFSL
jgi:scyllo-inositol 2-dehydrogenase (NADP+)